MHYNKKCDFIAYMEHHKALKASTSRMTQGKFKNVSFDKNIHFSKWKRRILKIFLKIKQTRGRVFLKQEMMMQGI